MAEQSGAGGSDGEKGRRGRRLAILGLGLTALVALAVGIGALTGRAPDAAPLTRGDQRDAPNFSLPDLRRPEARVELAAYRGRPVVLNFWASWCVPCRREMPTFQAVSEQMGPRVAFVSVNHQDGQSAALRLLADTGVTHPAGYDPDGKVAASYNLRGMPTTVFISSTGQVLATRTGELSRTQLEKAIEDLFG
ncbi:MAG: TlpA family protein disulfide reductase [Actinomycetota bacterium]|nr:TlpA family protein disulfide reductase [Actinomycetota bacterium]